MALRKLHLASEREATLRTEVRPSATTRPPEPAPAPSPHPSVDPRGFALLDDVPSIPPNPLDDGDLEGPATVEEILRELQAIALEQQRAQRFLDRADALAAATAEPVPPLSFGPTAIAAPEAICKTRQATSVEARRAVG
jgi:hypothetical protein